MACCFLLGVCSTRLGIACDHVENEGDVVERTESKKGGETSRTGEVKEQENDDNAASNSKEGNGNGNETKMNEQAEDELMGKGTGVCVSWERNKARWEKERERTARREGNKRISRNGKEREREGNGGCVISESMVCACVRNYWFVCLVRKRHFFVRFNAFLGP